jgi:hypothetical protein
VKNKIVILVFVIGLILLSSGIPVSALRIGNEHMYNTIKADTGNPQNLSYEIFDLTPHEAWELLTNTSNGIQTPTDIRIDEEWNAGFIDTPYPESPIHYPLERIQDPEGLEEFLDLCYNKEVILYDSGKGGRIYIVFEILVEENFNGTIYYISEGLIAWKDVGLPIRNNTEPDAPTITGKTSGKVGEEYKYTFIAVDPDEDGIRYFIDWDDNNTEWTEFNYSGTDVNVKHSWNELGTYKIAAKTMDFYGNESDWDYLEVTILKNRQAIHSLFLRSLENHPRIFPMLQQILGLV